LVKDLAPGEPLPAEEVARRQDNGALLLDTRSAAAFAGGHVPGSISVGLGASFPIWAGWLAPYDREVVLILPADERYPDALRELRRIGVDNVAGFLAGGVAAWEASGRPVERLAEMTIAELAKRVGGTDDKTIVLDVRDPSEWAAGHIPGAQNVSAGSIAAGVTPMFADGRTVAVICGSGYRSSVASSLLQSRGIDTIVAVPSGMSTWSDAGLPTESGGPGEEAKPMYNRLVGPWQAQGAPSAAEVAVSELQRELAKGPIQIVDVREPEEWGAGHIPGSIHIPMGDVATRMAELDPELPVVTVCRIGVRSLLSADELLLAGFGDVRSLAGGIVAWDEAGQPLER
jgi:rhodanese-related sulfurtransferase